jgi:hypothetical protein
MDDDSDVTFFRFAWEMQRHMEKLLQNAYVTQSLPKRAQTTRFSFFDPASPSHLKHRVI